MGDNARQNLVGHLNVLSSRCHMASHMPTQSKTQSPTMEGTLYICVDQYSITLKGLIENILRVASQM